jgi:adenine-specific DNA-methyltransferase
MTSTMPKKYDQKYWQELCESFEAANGVVGAKKIIEIPFDITEWDALGNHYVQVTSKEHKSKNGQFFTPKSVVEYLIESTEYETDQTVADISCGSGRFLIGVLEKMITEKKDLKTIQDKVFGFDIDPVLVRITLANIRSFLAQNGYQIKSNTDFNISAQNSLENSTGLFANNYKFDCILGNPPYLKATPKNNLGHPNLYASFVEVGIDYLKKGGKLGFIIPKSFVSGAYFKRLRQILSKNVLTKEIITLYERDKAFNDVLQEQVLLTLENKNPDFKDITVGVAFTNGEFKIKKFKSEFDVVFWDDDIMCIPSSQVDVNLVKKCFKNGFTKIHNSGLRVSTGQVVAYRRKQYFDKKENKKYRPLYWSHNISSRNFEPDKKQEKRHAEMMDSEETKSEIIYDSVLAFKRISAKEQSRRLEGAVIPQNKDGYFLENHLNFMKRESKNAPSLKVMELLLNSRLWDKLFRLINGNTQVSAKEIRIFPIPHDIESLKNFEDKKTDETQLEEIIHQVYGLSKEESDYVLSSRNEIM